MSIKITEVRNAVSVSADNSRIHLELNHPIYGWTPYALYLSDTDTTIDNRELLELIGENFAPYVPPTQDEIDEAAAAEVRTLRDALLTETDWTAMNDVTMSDAMATYRQALRDVTEQDGFPHNITWPTKPE